MNFYWRNNFTTNSFKNFKKDDPFILLADNYKIIQQSRFVMNKIGCINAPIKFDSVDYDELNYGWNGLTEKINKLREKINLPPYPFSHIYKGSVITANIFNEIRDSFNPIYPYLYQKIENENQYIGMDYLKFVMPTLKHQNDMINADYFNQIADMLSLDKLIYTDEYNQPISRSTPYVPAMSVAPRQSQWIADHSYQGLNPLTGKQFMHNFLGTVQSNRHILGSLNFGYPQDGSRTYINSYDNHFNTLYVNILPDNYHGAVCNAELNGGHTSTIGSWAKIPQETLECGTFGIYFWAEHRYDVTDDIKESAGIHLVVHNEVPNLQVVVLSVSDDPYFPRINCYDDIDYATCGQKVYSDDTYTTFTWKEEFRYPIRQSIILENKRFIPYYYKGYIYYVGKDYRIHRYNPSNNTWNFACGGKRFDVFDNNVYKMWYRDNYLYILPRERFGAIFYESNGYNMSTDNCIFLYRINLYQSDNTLEKIQFDWLNNTGKSDYETDYAKDNDWDVVNPTSGKYLYSVAWDGSGNPYFYITDLDNKTVDYSYRYKYAENFYADAYESFKLLQNHLDFVEYVELGKTALYNNHLYYFTINNEFKKIDLGCTEYILNPRTVNGSGNTGRLNEEKLARTVLSSPPEPCDFVVYDGNKMYAQSITSQVTQIYAYDIGSDYWTKVTRIPDTH